MRSYVYMHVGNILNQTDLLMKLHCFVEDSCVISKKEQWGYKSTPPHML